MILLLTEVFPPRRGSSCRWLWDLYRRMPQGSVPVVADSVPSADIFDMTHDLPISRIPLRFPNWGVFNRGSWWSYLEGMRTLRRVVRRVQPSVIHCGKCLPEG